MARSCQRADCVRDQSPYYFALQRYPCARTARAAQRTCSLPIPSSVATPRSRTAATGTRHARQAAPGQAGRRSACVPGRCGANPCSISTFPWPTARFLWARRPWPQPECQIGRTGGCGRKGTLRRSKEADAFGASVSQGRQGLRLCEKCKTAGARRQDPVSARSGMAGSAKLRLQAASLACYQRIAMRFPNPVLRGTLIQRYKRFLADVRLDDGRLVTATCPNTGSMLGLTSPGATVWLSENASPTRKYRFTWEMVEADLGHGPTLVGINTQHPNMLVAEAMSARRIKLLVGYPGFRREVRYGENSRIDILLECAKKGLCYVEIGRASCR